MSAAALRQIANALTAVADMADDGGLLQAVLDRLDKEFPRVKALGAVEMAQYWGLSENTARDKMHAKGFPAEVLPGRIVVSKLALALYEIRRMEK